MEWCVSVFGLVTFAQLPFTYGGRFGEQGRKRVGVKIVLIGTGQ